jgi:hypothetical protein
MRSGVLQAMAISIARSQRFLRRDAAHEGEVVLGLRW